VLGLREKGTEYSRVERMWGGGEKWELQPRGHRDRLNWGKKGEGKKKRRLCGKRKMTGWPRELWKGEIGD